MASWEGGNFRSLLGQLQSTAEDRKGAFELGEKLAGREERPGGGGVSVTGDKLAERLSGEK